VWVERARIIWSVIATTLVACGGGGTGPPPRSAVASAHAEPESNPSTGVSEAREPLAAPSHEKTLHPEDMGFELSFGRFGYPCDLERDSTTHVIMLHCDRVDAPDEAGITVNFYLPGVWSAEPFTAESVAVSIRDNHSPNTRVLGAFAAPDSATGKLTFFLTTSTVYPDTSKGQAFIMKVAPLEDAVYSVFYTTMFSGRPEAMEARIREWLAAHITEYGREIGSMTLDPSWVTYLRSELRQPSPPNRDR